MQRVYIWKPFNIRKPFENNPKTIRKQFFLANYVNEITIYMTSQKNGGQIVYRNLPFILHLYYIRKMEIKLWFDSHYKHPSIVPYLDIAIYAVQCKPIFKIITLLVSLWNGFRCCQSECLTEKKVLKNSAVSCETQMMSQYS